MKQIVVENIKEEDVSEIVKLGLNTTEIQIQDETPEYFDVKTLKKFITSPDDIYLVARIDNQIAGYRLATYNKYLQEAYLIDLVVKPEFRKMGVAEALYKKTFEILKEKKCKFVWVLAKENNEPIQNLLIKQGFKKGSTFNLYHRGI